MNVVQGSTTLPATNIPISNVTERWVGSLRPTRNMRLGFGAFVALLASTFLTFGLAPASASTSTTNDPNSGSIDTSVTSVVTESSPQTLGDECTGDKCKRINWCSRAGEKQPLALADDAPMVVLSDKDTPPPCIKRPQIVYKKRCLEGKACIEGAVKNLSGLKMKIKVRLDDREPIIKWVDGHGSFMFKFENVSNGDHKLSASVWVGGDTWCMFKAKEIPVDCTPTSPTPSQSPEPTQSPEPSQSTTPGEQLPQTGTPVGMIAGVGSATALAGALLLFGLRRRRDNLTTVE